MKRYLVNGLGGIVTAVAMQLVVAGVEASHGEAAGECAPCEPAACEPCEAVDNCGHEAKHSPYFWGAWVESGFWANEYGRGNTYDNHGRWETVSGNTSVLQNVRMTDVQMNQMVLNFGKKIDHHKRFDIGGRTDVMFGTDAVLLQSSGLESAPLRDVLNHHEWNWQTGDYATALTQAYAEIGFGKLSVKLGKMLSKISSESPYSTERFFYSLSDTYAMTPHTLGGVVASYEVAENLEAFGGWTQGYRSHLLFKALGTHGSTDMFFDSDKNNAFYGGLEYKLGHRAKFLYTLLVGRDTEFEGVAALNNVTLGKRNMFVNGLVGEFELNERWSYKIEWVLRSDTLGVEEGGHHANLATGAYGISNELLYKLNKRLAIGGRAEWGYDYEYEWNEENHLHRGADDKYAFSLAANWKPMKSLLVKPEIRFDEYSHEQRFNDDTRRTQFSGGVSVVVKR
ncbi:MAG: outer membrane beta-barrel protein [Thermoguttaceae bacterium]